MNVSAWSIRNPVPAILLFVLLSLAGLWGLRALGIQNFPDMDFPTVTVSASLEGAAPSQLETEVARPLENQIATLGDVQHITTTITDGAVSVSVEFPLEKNSEEALNQVRNAVDSVKAKLPAAMQTPTVSKVNTSGQALITYSVQAANLSEAELSWFIDNDVNKALLATRGVGKVARVGGVDREILVALDPLRLNALGASVATVASQLGNVQQDSAGGQGRVSGGQQTLRTLGATGDVATLAALPIPLGDGRHVRLDQLATVSDTQAERSTYARMDGKPVIGFQVTRSKGESEVAVVERTRQTVAQLQAAHPQIRIAEAYNTVASIEDNYQGSMHLLLEGAILAVLVVWWFLRDGRATFVSATALPLSILPTFALMYYWSFSLNTLTLLALALVIGILVDDAIVEVENIVRHLRMGKSPRQAALEAADEIGLAVIATTFTLVAVFLPTAFMSGITGRFFRQFGLTAAAAVLASLLVARLLTPMMAASMLKAHPVQQQDSKLMQRYLGWAGWCMAHRKTTLAAAGLFFVASLALVPLLPTGFVPAADVGRTSITVTLPAGSTLDDTRAVVAATEQRVLKVAHVRHVFSSVGTASTGGGPGASSSNSNNSATLTITLTPRSERSVSQAVIEDALRATVRDVPGARLAVGGQNTGEKLQLTLTGEDSNALLATTRQLERELRSLPGIGNVQSDASLQQQELQITPHAARAAELGVTSSALADTVRLATYGDFSTSLAKLSLPQRQLDIRVRLDDSVRGNLTALGQLRVPATSGSVPLQSVAALNVGSGPSQINRRDRQRQVTLDVELGQRSMGEVQQQANALPTLRQLPAGVSLQPSGDAERMGELFGNFGMAMAVGVLCIYVVLVLLFHDFLQPLTILMALPLSVGGAFLALLLTGNSFSMPSIIGLLMLMGVVTKNAILLVEYAVKARREQGLTRLAAMLDACHKRAQPILMTTVAMGAGMLPIALGLSADPSFRAPMAIAVIGGLLTSTLLSLLVVPVVYTVVDDMQQWLRRWLPQHEQHADTSD
ncbi:efflux RND transporter permease subunit [Vogesella sp. DC21W]|uniref:Efflux RND transporter permease subunit n=1 Tax=Vogesella aquatica TaxID=2984206 RepID=A0ABT5IZ45_9NEIS|nr:efflux RND transporter permease subunit [Vogesella aquatica]MDC7717851.1 efflux RND transporter permease subunit [Vogesella aquatica]